MKKSKLLTRIFVPVAAVGVMGMVNAPMVSFAAENVEINEGNFPDATFRDYVSESFDKDGDGTLSSSEIKAVEWIDVYDMGISDLTGLNYFTEITGLSCGFNNLKELDVSANTKLESIDCEGQGFSSKIYDKFGYSNDFDDYDFDPNDEVLGLTSLDLSNNTKLLSLRCAHNDIEYLDVRKNTLLESVFCGYNKLSELDLGKKNSLYMLYCYGNNLSSLDVSGAKCLYELFCENNQLTELDISSNTKLQVLSCKSNKISTLDVRKNKDLFSLSCDKNVNVKRNSQKITVKKTSAAFKENLLMKKAQSFKLGASAKGKITCVKKSGSNKLSLSKGGKVTIKKGTSKGTYKMKVEIAAKATITYDKAVVTKTVKVKVK